MRVERERAAEAGDGLLGPALLVAEHAHVAMEQRAGIVERDRPAYQPRRLLDAALALCHQAQKVMGVGMLRHASEDVPVGRRGLVQPAYLVPLQRRGQRAVEVGRRRGGVGWRRLWAHGRTRVD
jgi:hypothetical protein